MKTIKALKANYREWAYYYFWDPGFQVYNKVPLTLFEKIILWIADTFNNNRAKRECERLGHDWDYSADIGPDSGSEDIDCKRCGLSHHINYY